MAATATAADRQPVLVGVGRFTARGGTSDSLAELVARAVRLAIADACDALPPSAATSLTAAIDAVACPGTFLDLTCERAGLPKPYPNLPASVAKAVGASIAPDHCFTTGPSGNAPQAFVNSLASRIAEGRVR